MYHIFAMRGNLFFSHVVDDGMICLEINKEHDYKHRIDEVLTRKGGSMGSTISPRKWGQPKLGHGPILYIGVL